MAETTLPGQEELERAVAHCGEWPRWVHVLAVLVVEDENGMVHEASNYVPVEIRFSFTGNFQMRTNQPRFFKCTRSGYARLAFMNGEFERLMFVNVGDMRPGLTLEVLQ